MDKDEETVVHTTSAIFVMEFDFVLWYVVLENVPGVSGFNNSSGIVEKYWEQPILESLYDLFIAPAAFQLWFLRDLLVMLVFTPILWWIAKRQWMVSLIMALCSTIFIRG